MNAPNQLSFLPEDYLAVKRARRTNLICAGLFVAVMGGVSGAFLVSERMTSRIEKRHAAVEQQYADAAKRIAQVTEMQEKQQHMVQQAELTESLLEKVPRSKILADITNAIPTGVSLIDYELVSKVIQAAPQKQMSDFEKKKAEIDAANNAKKAGMPALPPPKVYEVSMKMTGMASTDGQVAQFLKDLSKSKLLKDVNLVISDEFTQDKTKLRKFQIEAMLDPAAQVGPGDPDKRLKTASAQ